MNKVEKEHGGSQGEKKNHVEKSGKETQRDKRQDDGEMTVFTEEQNDCQNYPQKHNLKDIQ